MEPRLYGTEKEYMDSVLGLVNSSSDFLNNLKENRIKFISLQSRGRLDELIDLVNNAELKFVKDLGPIVTELDQELAKLIGKFQVIKKTYKTDCTLQSFLGNFSKDQGEVYRKLTNIIDSSIRQIDIIIAKYSQIEREKISAKQWINTVLSHYSTESATQKARNAKQIIKTMEELVEEIRAACHNAKLELLNIRTATSKYATRGIGTEQRFESIQRSVKEKEEFKKRENFYTRINTQDATDTST